MSDLDRALASPDSKAPYVRRLFHTIADRYDLITVLLSFGLDRRWKQQLIALSGAREGARALDLACGTGDIAFGLADRGARLTGLDITFRMLQLAKAKQRGANFLAGDMTSLPFIEQSFDLVTTGYGIRNVPRIEPAIAEMHRVLRPGGVLLSLDFDRPDNAILRAIYLGYLTLVGSALGWALHRDPDTYRYIPESIRRYPGARGVVRLMTAAGFSDARYIPVLGGFMAIHIGTKS